MRRPVSDIAFTPTVKAVQVQHGSRDAYARMERERGWEQTITPELEAFIAERDSLYLGTANADGQPYIQHRGGPKGFLKVLDERTVAFADFRGNKQYITVGTLAENDQAFIFLMDYAQRRQCQSVGPCADRRRRSCFAGTVGRAILYGTSGTGHRLHRRGVGCQLPAAYLPRDLRKRKSPQPCRHFTTASRSLRRKMAPYVGSFWRQGGDHQAAPTMDVAIG